MAIEPNINFILDIGEGRVEELITYIQLLDHLEQADEQDTSMDQEPYRFSAIIGHEGPLKATDSNCKGRNQMSKLNGKLVKLHLNH